MNARTRISWAAVLVVGGLLCFYGFWSGAHHMSDFAGYYTAARVLATHDSLSHIYDEHWFVNRMHRYGIPDSTLLMYVNPPPIAFVMTPVAWMKPSDAKTAWNIINVILLFIAFELLRRSFNLPLLAPMTPLIAALLVCTLPLPSKPPARTNLCSHVRISYSLCARLQRQQAFHRLIVTRDTHAPQILWMDVSVVIHRRTEMERTWSNLAYGVYRILPESVCLRSRNV
jgi:hypothetical protein